MSDSQRWTAAIAGLYFLYRVLRKDVDGLGKTGRKAQSLAERRWKHDLAVDLDEINHPTARKVAKKLREDAWRD